MALTQISTAGVKDDAVTSGKIPANAVGSSELADNAVDTAAIADDAVTDAKLANSINSAIAANTAKNTNATHTGDVTGSGSLTIASGAVTTAKIADQGVTLAKLPHGDGSSDGKFLRANNGADPSFETVTSTTINNNADNRVITGSGTANTLNGESGLSYDGSVLQINGDGQFTGNDGTANQLKWDKSEDSLYFRDNVKSQFGTGGDLQIYHDGTHSRIDNATGVLYIRNNTGTYNGNPIQIQPLATEDAIKAIPNGSVELYYDNSKKFETSSSGVTVTGTLAATAVTGDGSGLTGISSFVSGMIILWSGAQNAIPSGWVLCDGGNSTPDLRDRFVVGAGSSYGVDDTGGATSVTLTSNQIPAHGHAFSASNTHNHGITQYGYYNSGAFNYNSIGSGYPYSNSTSTVNTNNATISISGTTSNTGGGQSHENRPPYYALCYIMKT